MKIIDNGRLFTREECYPCYSLKLNSFLQEEKEIMPIRVTINKTTGKTCFIYILTDKLDSALQEWSDRKYSGNYYYPKKKDGEKSEV